MSKDGRADRGGEIGVNGQTYQGGQFLPSSKTTEKGARKTKKVTGSGKQEIAPYEWAVPEAEGVVSLYRQFIIFVSPWDLKAGRISVNTVAALYYGHSVQDITDLAQRWLDGERWIAKKV